MSYVNRPLTPGEAKQVLSEFSGKPGPKSKFAPSLRLLTIGEGIEFKFDSLDSRRKAVRTIRVWGNRHGMTFRTSYPTELAVWVIRES